MVDFIALKILLSIPKMKKTQRDRFFLCFLVKKQGPPSRRDLALYWVWGGTPFGFYRYKSVVFGFILVLSWCLI